MPWLLPLKRVVLNAWIFLSAPANWIRWRIRRRSIPWSALAMCMHLVQSILDHGADVNAVDPTGRTPLIYAVTSDLLPLDVVKLLVERGANVNARSQHEKSGDSGR